MTLEEFEKSLRGNNPPSSTVPALRALWLDGKGDWDAAHKTVQEDESLHAAWVHAYLHRKEGDLSNAGYWYRQAQKQACQDSLENEWRDIAAALLELER